MCILSVAKEFLSNTELHSSWVHVKLPIKNKIFLQMKVIYLNQHHLWALLKGQINNNALSNLNMFVSSTSYSEIIKDKSQRKILAISLLPLPSINHLPQNIFFP
jgi:hypothetical protein